MVRTLVSLAVLAALATSATAQTGALPAPLLQAVSATEAAKAPFAFDYHLETPDQNWRARFEPRATPRLRLVTPARDSLNDEERRAFDRLAEQTEGLSWCAGEGMGRIANVRLIREDDASATYAFQPTRESIRGGQARQYAERMRGEFTLTKDDPDVARLRLYIPSAFSPMPLVNVQHFNLTIDCAQAPNGRQYAAETTTEIRGSAFGRDFNQRSVQRVRNPSAP